MENNDGFNYLKTASNILNTCKLYMQRYRALWGVHLQRLPVYILLDHVIQIIY